MVLFTKISTIHTIDLLSSDKDLINAMKNQKGPATNKNKKEEEEPYEIKNSSILVGGNDRDMMLLVLALNDDTIVTTPLLLGKGHYLASYDSGESYDTTPDAGYVTIIRNICEMGCTFGTSEVLFIDIDECCIELDDPAYSDTNTIQEYVHCIHSTLLFVVY